MSETQTPLLAESQTEQLTERWEEVQASFVDRPQEAVKDADALVSELVEQVTATLAKERQRLEGQWSRGDDVDTEDLRVALRKYRSFFDRLLAT